MAVEAIVNAGVRNAFARQPKVDRPAIENRLRRANRSLGRGLGRIEWAGSFPAFIRRSADLMVDGWTIDCGDPLESGNRVWDSGSKRWGPERRQRVQRLERLREIERQLWRAELSAHSTARLTKRQRLPVYLRALEQPAFASESADELLVAAKWATRTPEPRARDFASCDYWKSDDPHWKHAQACSAIPFLIEIAHCFAAGLLGAATLRRAGVTRTILLERPRISQGAGRLHEENRPAVVWPDGTERWYWQGIEVPLPIAAARDQITAEIVARIPNQELRRVALERLGWQRFLETANAELRAQDDYGKLWATQVWLDGERTHLVEVVNATAEPDGSHRRYFLRVPPQVRTAREAVAWTFGFDNDTEYIVSAAS